MKKRSRVRPSPRDQKPDLADPRLTGGVELGETDRVPVRIADDEVAAAPGFFLKPLIRRLYMP